MQDEFDKICDEKNVSEKLNELDGLHAQQSELEEVGISIRQVFILALPQLAYVPPALTQSLLDTGQTLTAKPLNRP